MATPYVIQLQPSDDQSACKVASAHGVAHQTPHLWAAGTCGDVPPTTDLTCQQELALNLCSEPFMKGFCNLSCGRCNAGGQ